MQISPKAAAELIKSDPRAKLLDVRTQKEFEIACISGALLVASEEAVNEVMSWAKDTPVVVYCHYGIRSMEAVTYLSGHGFTNVKSMTGGIEHWSLEVDSNVPRY